MVNMKTPIIVSTVVSIVIPIIVERALRTKLPSFMFNGDQQCEEGVCWMNTTNSKYIVEGMRLTYKSYKVRTSDGYILNLNRIIDQDKKERDRGVPVLFVNGLMMHSEAWLLHAKPELDLPVAYLLEGYDVWLGDPRGSIRSREHVSYSTYDWRFWDFSFHEMGLFDFPAFIDFILATTGQPKLTFVGLSLAGASYYAMCTEKPEYQEKLYGGILWQPVGEMPQMEDLPSNTKRVMMMGQVQLSLGWSIGKGDAPPFYWFFRTLVHGLCKASEAGALIGTESILGKGCQWQVDMCTQLTLGLGGSSAKTVLHTFQLFSNGGIFNQYDYGTKGNMQRYGSREAPEYDMSKLKLSTAIYTSDIDVYTPTPMIRAFAKKFGGPTYVCQMEGACHGFIAFDPRTGPFVQDSIEVLNAMTGWGGREKLASGQCTVPKP